MKTYSININRKLEIDLYTLINLCYPSNGMSALWVDSIEIMESLDKIYDCKLNLKTNVMIEQKYGAPTITITLGDILESIKKICQGGIVRKDLQKRIFNSYYESKIRINKTSIYGIMRGSIPLYTSGFKHSV